MQSETGETEGKDQAEAILGTGFRVQNSVGNYLGPYLYQKRMRRLDAELGSAVPSQPVRV